MAVQARHQSLAPRRLRDPPHRLQVVHWPAVLYASYFDYLESAKSKLLQPCQEFA